MGCIKFFNFRTGKFTQPRANQIMNNKEKERVELQAGLLAYAWPHQHKSTHSLKGF